MLYYILWKNQDLTLWCIGVSGAFPGVSDQRTLKWKNEFVYLLVLEGLKTIQFFYQTIILLLKFFVTSERVLGKRAVFFFNFECKDSFAF